MTKILEVNNITKSFGGVQAIRGCTLNVESQSITGLIGANGAGKTTLFDVISGLCKPDGGQVFFKGEKIDNLPIHERTLRGIVKTFQIPREFGNMTVLENLLVAFKYQRGENLINLFLRPKIVTDQEDVHKQEALEILEFVGLKNLRNEYASNLSAGQKKLLELARALMTKPDLILLDEPTGGVNPMLIKEITKRISSLREHDKTFFIIEHKVDVIFKLADIVYVMNQGIIIAHGKPEDIRRDKKVIHAYFGA